MKLNIKNITKSLGLILTIFLLLSMEVESAYKSISVSKYRKAQLKNQRTINPPFPRNPLANLLAGIKNIFFPSDPAENFYQCFPKSWTNGALNQKERTGFFDKFTSFIQFLGKKIIKHFPDGPVMQFICKNRETMINKIKSFLPIGKRLEASEKSYGKLNKKNKHLKKGRLSEKWLGNLGKSLVSGAKKIANVSKKIAGPVAAKILSGVNIIKDQVIKMFVGAKNFIVSVIKMLVTFFKDVLFAFAKCFNANKKLFFATTFAAIAFKLHVKMAKFTAAVAGGVIMVYLSHEFLGYVCMREDNKETNGKLLKAFNSKDENTKALLMGEGLASMVKTFAYAA